MFTNLDSYCGIIKIEVELWKIYLKNTESEVRSYCRTFPKEFAKSKGAIIEDVDGNKYIDFFDGAGALNYGIIMTILKRN